MVEFSLDEAKYPQNQYFGRLKTILDLIDPRTLFVTSAQREQCQKMLNEYRNKTLSESVGDEQLWYCRKVIESSVHPVTGEVLNPFTRMSCFVPMNIPMAFGMLTMTSLPATVFMQWMNQSYNSACNYANRSGADMSVNQIMTSYAVATTTACGLGYGLRVASSKGPAVIGRITKALPGLVPYIAVGCAGSANILFTRSQEIQQGVSIFDESGNEVGVSKTAAFIGIKKTIISRGLGLPLPVILLPGIFMTTLEKSGVVAGKPKLKLALELSCITVCLAGALPATLAMFPQKLPLSVGELELEFHDLSTKDGRKIDTVYVNKGL